MHKTGLYREFGLIVVF